MDERPKKVKNLGSVPEAAYNILKNSGSPMHHKDITDRLLSMLADAIVPDPKFIARIHTDINLDNRFIHVGNGMWSLKEWVPKKTLQQKAVPAWQPKVAAAKARKPEFWRGGDDDAEEPVKAEEEESEWPRDHDEDNERPEAE